MAVSIVAVTRGAGELIKDGSFKGQCLVGQIEGDKNNDAQNITLEHDCEIGGLVVQPHPSNTHPGTLTATLYKNGQPTPVTVTVSDEEVVYGTKYEAFEIGDDVRLVWTASGAPGASFRVMAASLVINSHVRAMTFVGCNSVNSSKYTMPGTYFFPIFGKRTGSATHEGAALRFPVGGTVSNVQLTAGTVKRQTQSHGLMNALGVGFVQYVTFEPGDSNKRIVNTVDPWVSGTSDTFALELGAGTEAFNVEKFAACFTSYDDSFFMVAADAVGGEVVPTGERFFFVAGELGGGDANAAARAIYIAHDVRCVRFVGDVVVNNNPPTLVELHRLRAGKSVHESETVGMFIADVTGYISVDVDADFSVGDRVFARTYRAAGNESNTRIRALGVVFNSESGGEYMLPDMNACTLFIDSSSNNQVVEYMDATYRMTEADAADFEQFIYDQGEAAFTVSWMGSDYTVTSDGKYKKWWHAGDVVIEIEYEVTHV